MANAAMKDSRLQDHERACSHVTVHSRLGLHRSKHQLLDAGSLELGKESLQYRLNVAQEENRSGRVTLLLGRRVGLAAVCCPSARPALVVRLKFRFPMRGEPRPKYLRCPDTRVVRSITVGVVYSGLKRHCPHWGRAGLTPKGALGRVPLRVA